MNHKIIVLLAVLIFALSTVNATLLASASIDKNTLYTNEIGLLSVKIFNDSDVEVNEVIVKAMADSEIRFVQEIENDSYTTAITSIAPRTEKEIMIKIKAISTKKESAGIYIYFGTSQPFTQAIVTNLYTKESPVKISTTMQKTSINGKDAVLIDFKLTNSSKDVLKKVSAEVIAPTEFDNITAPIYQETISVNSNIEEKFEVIAPIDAVGEQKIVLAYGFFDLNTPHYFEEEFKVNFVKPNYTLIILIGILVLVIAVYLYLKKDKHNEIKGTAEKKK